MSDAAKSLAVHQAARESARPQPGRPSHPGPTPSALPGLDAFARRVPSNGTQEIDPLLGSFTPDQRHQTLLAWQRAIGNVAVQRLLDRGLAARCEAAWPGAEAPRSDAQADVQRQAEADAAEETDESDSIPINVTTGPSAGSSPDRVYFDTDSAEIRGDAAAALGQLVERLRREPTLMIVRLEGHADTRHSEQYNVGLSERRAAAVYRFLAGSVPGADPGQVRDALVAGHGEAQPAISPETGPAELQANRRVEIVLGERPGARELAPAVRLNPDAIVVGRGQRFTLSYEIRNVHDAEQFGGSFLHQSPRVQHVGGELPMTLTAAESGVLTMQAGDECGQAEITLSALYRGAGYDSNPVRVAIGIAEDFERDVSAEGETASAVVNQTFEPPSWIQKDLREARARVDAEARATAKAALDKRVLDVKREIEQETATSSCRPVEFDAHDPVTFTSVLPFDEQYSRASNTGDPDVGPFQVQTHVFGQRYRASTKVRYTAVRPVPGER